MWKMLTTLNESKISRVSIQGVKSCLCPNSTNHPVWPLICRNKPAIKPKWFNSSDTNSNVVNISQVRKRGKRNEQWNFWEKNMTYLYLPWKYTERNFVDWVREEASRYILHADTLLSLYLWELNTYIVCRARMMLILSGGEKYAWYSNMRHWFIPRIIRIYMVPGKLRKCVWFKPLAIFGC